MLNLGCKWCGLPSNQCLCEGIKSIGAIDNYRVYRDETIRKMISTKEELDRFNKTSIRFTLGYRSALARTYFETQDNEQKKRIIESINLCNKDLVDEIVLGKLIPFTPDKQDA